MTKEKIEKKLKDTLYECLASDNQECRFTLNYDPKTNSAAVIFEDICIVEEDNYAGFAGY